MKRYSALLITLLVLSACCGLWLSQFSLQARDSRENVIFLTTMGRVTDKQVALAVQEIEAFYGIKVVQIGKNELPASAYCTTRKRYVAVKALRHIKSKSIPHTSRYNYKTLVITDRDIETERGRHWGVMGLAFLGGNEGVVSTFRLKGSEERLKKVTLHETGHMLGISHCSSGTASCFMNDAKGKGATVDRARVFLCGKCRSKMRF